MVVKLTTRLATALVAVSLVAPRPVSAAQDTTKVSRRDEFKNCILKNKGYGPPPEHCLNLVSIEGSRDWWGVRETNEYGRASALAEWKELDEVPCDSLMDFMHSNLPLVRNPKSGKPQKVFIHWMTVHEDDSLPSLKGFNGATVPRGPKGDARVYYVYLRSNYPGDKNGWPPWRAKERKYEALSHEMRHAMGVYDHVGKTDRMDTDVCTKRRVKEEERAKGGLDELKNWGTVDPLDCKVKKTWDCIEITFDGIDDAPDHPDNEDPSGDSKECGLIYLSEMGDAYFVCKGAPLRVCVLRTELTCADGGGDLGGGDLGRAACAVPDADARRAKSGIRTPGARTAE